MRSKYTQGLVTFRYRGPIAKDGARARGRDLSNLTERDVQVMYQEY